MPLIHQIILGRSVPRLNEQCLDSWRALEDRGFSIVRWTDASVRDYLAECSVMQAPLLYKAARNRGEASDILRVAITYSYGGLYVDWDVLLLDPDRFLTVMPGFESSGCVLLQDPPETRPDFVRSYDNSLFYMSQGNPLALDFLGEIERNYLQEPLPNTPFLTGPLALTRFLDDHPRHKSACHFVDTRNVYSFNYADVQELTKDDRHEREILKERRRPGGAPAIHFWTHAWAPKPKWSQRLRATMFRAFAR